MANLKKNTPRIVKYLVNASGGDSADVILFVVSYTGSLVYLLLVDGNLTTGQIGVALLYAVFAYLPVVFLWVLFISGLEKRYELPAVEVKNDDVLTPHKVISSQEAIASWRGSPDHKVVYVDKLSSSEMIATPASVKGNKSSNMGIGERIDPRSTWGQIRELAFSHYGKVCEQCGATKSLNIHHRVPLSLGGPNTIANLEILCKHCHEDITGHELFNDYDVDDMSDYASHETKARRVYESIEKRKPLKINYTKFSGEKSTRTIKPIRIFEENNRVYVRAFCELRGENRTFRLSRMRIV